MKKFCMARMGVLLAVGLHAVLADAAAELSIAVRGETNAYAIVIPKGTAEAERYAAEELRDFTEKATGVILPIMDDDAPLPDKAVLIGETRYSGKILGESGGVRTDFGTDGFRIVTKPPYLLVLGTAERGTLYGVYELLERFAGCRWYASWHTVVPKAKRFAVPAGLDETHIPAIKMRDPYWYDVVKHPEFAARLRVNGSLCRINAAKFGGNPYRFGGGLEAAHTFGKLIPFKKYGKEHPDWFSKTGNQPCLTNPDVLALATSNVLSRIRADPSAKFYGVSQNDGGGPSGERCLCKRCKAVEAEEGSASGPIVRFVNAVAEAVEKEFPEKIIETLAYGYSIEPPKKTRLRHNVMVCLCCNGVDFARPIETSPVPSTMKFRDWIDKWGEQTRILYLWDYFGFFRDYPLPKAEFMRLQPNMKFFRAHNVKMMFLNGAHNGGHADFAELKAWLTARLMWNPDLDMKKTLDDFFSGYYGKAAPFVRAYFDELHRAQLEYLGDRGEFAPGELKNITALNPALSDDFIERSLGLWTKAIDAVKDDATRSFNVKMGAFTVKYMKLERLIANSDKVAWLAKSPPPDDIIGECKSLAKEILAHIAATPYMRLAQEKNVWKDKIDKYHNVLQRNGHDLAMAQGGVVEIEERHFSCGKWSRFVDDPMAGDGKAVKIMPEGAGKIRSCQLPFQIVKFEPGEKYRFRACVRVEGGDGVFQVGMGSPTAVLKHVYSRSVRTEKGCGTYCWYDILTCVPQADYLSRTHSDYIYICPSSSGGTVFVDKLEISRYGDTKLR